MRLLERTIAVLLTTAILTTTVAFANVEAAAGKPSASTGTKVTEAAEAATNAADADAADAEKKESRRITVMLTGDLMCQPMQQIKAFDGRSYNFRPTFKYVKKIFDKADIVIGNLETLVSKSLPLSKDMNRLQSKPYLNAPAEWLDALEYAGFDGFIMANNHACDGGETGILETLEELDSRGIPHTGLFKDNQENRYFTMEQNGIKIGVISYAAYYNLKEKFLSGSARDYMLNRPIQAKMNADVQALRREGAKFIIAYNHAGTEYSQVPAPRQERYGRMLAQAGVDYIIGSHPHVLQPYEPLLYGEDTTPYIYSMGNFTSAMLDPITKETLILSLTLEKTESGKVVLADQTYYPCYMLDEYEKEPFVLIPEDEDYNGNLYENAPAALVNQLKKNFKHIRKIVGELD